MPAALDPFKLPTKKEAKALAVKALRKLADMVEDDKAFPLEVTTSAALPPDMAAGRVVTFSVKYIDQRG